MMFGEPADKALEATLDALSTRELETRIRRNLAFLHPGYEMKMTPAERLASGRDEKEPKMEDPKMPNRPTAEDLREWWKYTTSGDFELTAPKITEYGAADLQVMGAAMVALHPHVTEMTDAEKVQIGQEMAIAFYLLGKVSRLFGAYQTGGVPSDDTWHDATVYSLMGRRVREAGGWPV